MVYGIVANHQVNTLNMNNIGAITGTFRVVPATVPVVGASRRAGRAAGATQTAEIPSVPARNTYKQNNYTEMPKL